MREAAGATWSFLCKALQNASVSQGQLMCAFLILSAFKVLRSLSIEALVFYVCVSKSLSLSLSFYSA